MLGYNRHGDGSCAHRLHNSLIGGQSISKNSWAFDKEVWLTSASVSVSHSANATPTAVTLTTESWNAVCSRVTVMGPWTAHCWEAQFKTLIITKKIPLECNTHQHMWVHHQHILVYICKCTHQELGCSQRQSDSDKAQLHSSLIVEEQK